MQTLAGTVPGTGREKAGDTNIQSVQIMRGIASLLVVLLHISIKGEQYGNGAMRGFAIGGAGVDLFFIISGYIMCVSTVDRPLNFFQFLLLRIKRIIPLYWLTSTAALAVFLYNPKLINTSGGETSIWASYLLVPNGMRYLNSNGWTLSYEFLFYFIFGAFLHKGTWKAMGFSSIVLLLMVLAGICFGFQGVWSHFFTHILYLEFVFGMACFYWFARRGWKPDYRAGIALCVVGGLLLLLQWVLAVPESDRWRGLYWGIPMLLVFAGLLSLEERIRQSRSALRALFLGIGNSSYSLYLIHPFTLSGTAIVLKRLGMAANPYLFTVVLLVSSVAIGHICYLFIEKPLVALFRKKR